MHPHRRQVQMESAFSVPVRRVLAKALQAEGVRGLYRGFLPNALKNLPNKGEPVQRKCWSWPSARRQQLSLMPLRHSTRTRPVC